MGRSPFEDLTERNKEKLDQLVKEIDAALVDALEEAFDDQDSVIVRIPNGTTHHLRRELVTALSKSGRWNKVQVTNEEHGLPVYYVKAVPSPKQ